MGFGAVAAKSFARIHWHNLVDVGVLPTFADPGGCDRVKVEDTLEIKDAPAARTGADR